MERQDMNTRQPVFQPLTMKLAKALQPLLAVLLDAVAIGDQKRISLIPFAQIFLAGFRSVALNRQAKNFKNPTHQIRLIVPGIHIRKEVAHRACKRDTSRCSNDTIHNGSFRVGNSNN